MVVLVLLILYVWVGIQKYLQCGSSLLLCCTYVQRSDFLFFMSTFDSLIAPLFLEP